MRIVPFGSLFEVIRNGMNVKQDKSGVGLPITRIETISNANVDGTRVGYAGLAENDCKEWLLKQGDILFSHINSVEHIGKCAVYRGTPEKLVHGMNLLCLRSNTDKLLPEFGKYLIREKEFRARLSNFINKAVNQASVSISNLKTIPVRVPPLGEQRRIAEILDMADALRAKRRVTLVQLDSLNQSIFLELFGDPALGTTPYPIKPLESVLSQPLQNGAYFPKEKYCIDGGVEMVHMGDAFYEIIDRGKLKRVACSPKDIQKYSVTDKDILIARRSLTYDGAAKPCLIPHSNEPLIFESSFIRATPATNTTTVLYLFYYLSNVRVRRKFVYPFVTQIHNLRYKSVKPC